MKKISIVVISLLLAMTSFSTVLAKSVEENSGSMENPVIVEEKDLDITKNEKNDYKRVTEKVAKSIFDNGDNYVEESIKNVVKKSECRKGVDAVEEKIADVVKENSNFTKPSITLAESLTEEYEYTYEDGDMSVTLNPLYIEVTETKEFDDKEENADESNESVLESLASIFVKEAYAASKTKTKKFTESKAYYSWAGLKIFTVGMSCNFYYNGSKALYKSGFDGWYTRGSLSVWQVSNWKEKREKDGTSYTVWCGGNFHMGLEVKGVGIILDDKYIKHKASCDKKGKITLSRTGFKLKK